jgi:hypothetical protein
MNLLKELDRDISKIADLNTTFSSTPLRLSVILEEREVDGEPVYWLDARVQLGDEDAVSAETAS